MLLLSDLIMQSQPHELRIYETEQGDAPFVTWLEKLRDRKARAIVKKRLDRVTLGNFGDYRSVGQGVFELRKVFLNLELIMGQVIEFILPKPEHSLFCYSAVGIRVHSSKIFSRLSNFGLTLKSEKVNYE